MLDFCCPQEAKDIKSKRNIKISPKKETQWLSAITLYLLSPFTLMPLSAILFECPNSQCKLYALYSVLKNPHNATGKANDDCS